MPRAGRNARHRRSGKRNIAAWPANAKSQVMGQVVRNYGLDLRLTLSTSNTRVSGKSTVLFFY
jgi:hypothetical protein